MSRIPKFYLKLTRQKVLILFILFSCISIGDTKKRKKSKTKNVYQIYPLSYTTDFDYSSQEIPGGNLQSARLDLMGCGESETFFPDYEQCGLYHKCRVDELTGKWVRDDFYCDEGQSFDEELLTCVDIPCSDRPPYPEVPKEWPSCPRNARKLPVPNNCFQYFICWWTGSYYTYTLKTCPTYFQDSAQNCQHLDSCPQDWPEKTSHFDCGLRPDSGQQFQHPDDCQMYYECHDCSDPDGPTGTKTCLEIFTCDEGKIFDEKKKKCVKGTCPPKQNKLPPGYKCDGHNSLHVLASDCRSYYKCFTCVKNKPDDPDEWCYDGVQSCPAGTWFDDVWKTCIKSKKCPQDLLELPKEPGYKCSNDGEKNVHPSDCGQYYVCIKCSKPSQWCYEPLQCPMGSLWDDLQKKCIKTDSCPQEWKPLPPEPGWQCEQHGEKNQVPDKCNEYFICIKCDRAYEWCYTRHSCADGQTFDNELMQCVHGRCPQWPDILPTNWTCKQENVLEIDPTDCKRFYQCVKCPDNHPWCYIPDSCPPAQWFDERQKKCVVSDKCPSEDKELPEGWKCNAEGEVHVWPEDCRKYYECYRCSYPKMWCYEENICPAGETFDDIFDMCVLGKCPQDKKELPKGPGWHCEKAGQINVVPGKGNCSRYYECEVCSKPGGWCYTEHQCPEGQSFDDEAKMCIIGKCPQDPDPIPPNFNCSTNGELHAYPETDHCTAYYECVWTGEYFTWTNHDCDAGLVFDDILKKCVNPPCPQLLIEIGPEPEWKCTRPGDITVFPANCQQYVECYACSKPRGWCYLEIESCPAGSSFDQIQKVCVSGSCPQERPEITGNMSCSADLEQHVWETDCRKYYVCHRCEKPKGWCYEQQSCASGQTFDDRLKQCVNKRCPQLPPKIPANWNCSAEGEKHVVPGDCTKFYECIKCDDGPWCHTGIQSCPDGFTFDDTAKFCIRGRCPQFPEPVPPTWTPCEVDGELHVYPANCSMYYKCVQCPDMDDSCFTLHNCKDGETFDNTNKRCVKGRCKQWPPKLPEGYNCSADGELEVDPNDCSSFYKCLINCPDGDWCYEPGKCPAGYTFDRLKKTCVEGPCPSKLPKLPTGPGWHCGSELETHVFPDDCSSYYSCHRCEAGWCYEKHHCPAGETFDEDIRQCVAGRCPQFPEKIPEGVTCKEEGELHVNPDPKFCYEYFNCTKCPDGGWCYELEICEGDKNFDDTKKECVDGKCPQKGKKRPNKKDGWKCLFFNDAGSKKPDPKSCYCYYQCTWVVAFAKWKRHCCRPGSYYDEEIDYRGWCVKGDCPYKGRSGRVGDAGGQNNGRSKWNVQTFVLGK